MHVRSAFLHCELTGVVEKADMRCLPIGAKSPKGVAGLPPSPAPKCSGYYDRGQIFDMSEGGELASENRVTKGQSLWSVDEPSLGEDV